MEHIIGFSGCGEFWGFFVWLLFLLTPFTCNHQVVGWSCKWITDRKDKDRDTQFLFHRSTTISWSGGAFFPSQEKVVYSIERCKEIWPRVSFRCQEAHLFQACMDHDNCLSPPWKLLLLYLFILLRVYLVFISYVIVFFLISYSITTLIMSDYESHWMPHSNGLVPHLS